MKTAEPSRRYSPLIGARSRAGGPPYRIGVLPGEGSGPEIVQVALDVLDAVSGACGLAFDVKIGGRIGLDAERESGAALTEPVIRFCEDTFAAGGAILAGAGGGRFVYDLRRRFDLFCKLNPIRPWPELAGVARLRCRSARDVDVLLVRENVEGAYYSEWRVAEGELAQSCTHTERGIRRIVDAAARIALARRGELAVVVKRGGLPALAALWAECSRDVARRHGVAWIPLDVDLAAYRMVQEPETLDVVVAPNLFADILSDLGGVVAGSRALTYGGSFSPTGDAVYQTNHGSAQDLARRDRANPAGQVLALAMMLRESFGCEREAALVERALARVWSQGIRTQDLAEPGSRSVGTRELGRYLMEAVGDEAAAEARDGAEIQESA